MLEFTQMQNKNYCSLVFNTLQKHMVCIYLFKELLVMISYFILWALYAGGKVHSHARCDYGAYGRHQISVCSSNSSTMRQYCLIH